MHFRSLIAGAATPGTIVVSPQRRAATWAALLPDRALNVGESLRGQRASGSVACGPCGIVHDGLHRTLVDADGAVVASERIDHEQT